jgi:hypothetical protein
VVCFYYDVKTPQNQPSADMILTLQTPLFNLNKQTSPKILTFSEDELQEYLSMGAAIKRMKQYTFVLHYHTITIECPILSMKDGSYRIVWPSFKLPYRPYPIFVYLYAAILYLSSGESQRKTAARTAKIFGLETFDHSTISRFLPKIYQAIPTLVRYGAQIMSEWGALAVHAIRRKRWDEEPYERAERLCNLIGHILRAPPDFGCWLAQKHWDDQSSFLI